MTEKPFIITRSGIQFYYDSPTPDMINLFDIAWSLARLPRFLGHTERFYSVAEHSLRVGMEVKRLYDDPMLVKQALLHDAEEAYIGDLVAPLKYRLKRDYGGVWAELTRPVTAALAAKFDLPEQLDPRIDEVDKRMAATEGVSLVSKWIPFDLPPAIPNMSIALGNEDMAIEEYFAEYSKTFLGAVLATGVLLN